MQKDSLDVTDADREALRLCIDNCKSQKVVVTHGTDSLVSVVPWYQWYRRLETL